VFSPVTDSISEFHVVDTGEPQLVVFHESTIGTGDCSMLTIPDGEESGVLEWRFRAPDDEYLAGLDLNALVSVDSRADPGADAGLTMLFDGQSMTLMHAIASGVENLDILAFEQVFESGSIDSVILRFELTTRNDTTPLEHIFPQALRQCPGDQPSFTVSATYKQP
jgi:hypothetical protein